jgi:hypothetical protein
LEVKKFPYLKLSPFGNPIFYVLGNYTFFLFDSHKNDTVELLYSLIFKILTD